MRGRYLHNQVLIEPIVQAAQRLGLKVEREYPIRVGESTCSGDVFIYDDSGRILVEAETSSKRIANDILKARALQAELWIVVPNLRVGNSVRRKLLEVSDFPGSERKCVLLISQAIRGLERKFD